MFAPGGPTFLELTQQALASTREGYDLLAPKFDRTPFRTPDAILDAMAEALGTVDGDGLDVCCGTGAGASLLLRTVTGSVVGIDSSPGMLAVARANVPEARFDEGDAMDLPYDEAFDLAVCLGAFGHFRVHEQPALLSGIHRALRPGGRFVCVTSEQPAWTSVTAWAYRVFNLVMRVRNRLRRPPFVMYYLNFLLPEAADRLRDAGFHVEVQPLGVKGPYGRARLVIATKPIRTG